MPQIEQDEKTKLEKKIQEYNLFQWLALMPSWLPYVMDLFNRTPPAPVREIHVLVLRVGLAIFSLVCFAVVGMKIKKMQARMVEIEIGESRRRNRESWRRKDQENQAFSD